MNDFNRESRYIVIKRSDLAKVPVNYRRALVDPLGHLQAHLPRRECLVIESDWPEYEAAWRMIEARMTGTQPAEAEGVRDYLTEFAEGEIEAKTAIEELQDALSAVTAERDRLLEEAELHDRIMSESCAKALAERDQLRAEVEALREKADKYATIERVMEVLECDEREGGIWTACTLLLISSAHKMNSAKSVVDQEGVTVAGEQLGNWRVTVERIDAAMAAKEA